MIYLRAFLSGILFPTIVLPIALTIDATFGQRKLFDLLSYHYIPLIWGLWNVFHFAYLKNLNLSVTAAGAILGFILALAGVFIVGIPQIIGLTGNWIYLPIIVVPVIYAIIWQYIVEPVNHIVGIK